MIHLLVLLKLLIISESTGSNFKGVLDNNTTTIRQKAPSTNGNLFLLRDTDLAAWVN